MKQAYRFIISGKVQGVGYRRFVQKFCLNKSYEGWVRNLVDGSVEALIIAEDTELTEIEVQLKNLEAKKLFLSDFFTSCTSKEKDSKCDVIAVGFTKSACCN